MSVRICIGIDATSIDRWAKAAQASAIGERILSPEERERPIARQAESFATKEAVLKALGTGVVEHDPRDVELGVDELVLRGALEDRASKLNVVRWHHSSTSVGDAVIVLAVGETGSAESEGSSQRKRKGKGCE